MSDLENRVVSNINSLIMMLISKGIEKISLPKLVLYINREFNVQMDDTNLSEILTKNPSVASVDAGVITFGSSDDEEENVDNEVHDTAVDQAGDNLTSESIDLTNNFKLFETIKLGDEIEARNIVLQESDKDYFKHQGARKANCIYVISDICPQANINESYVHCKIKEKNLYVDVPVQRITK